MDAYWQGFVTSPFDQLPKLVIRDGIIYPTRILRVGGSLGPLAWPEGGAHDSWKKLERLQQPAVAGDAFLHR